MWQCGFALPSMCALEDIRAVLQLWGREMHYCTSGTASDGRKRSQNSSKVEVLGTLELLAIDQ